MSKRPIAIDDLFKIKLLGDPQISPDGKTIAFVQTTTDYDADKYQSHLWLVPSDASAPPIQFTFGAGKDAAPRWSPDGKWIAFTSNRDDEKNPQLYLIALEGGEAIRLTTDANKPSPAVWSPDGMQIAFTAKVVTKDAKMENDKRDDSDVAAYTRLLYKFDGEGFWDYGWRQIFVTDLTPVPFPEREGGKVRQLTRGNFNHAEPAWSPDSKTIILVSNHSARADETNVTDLWNVPAKGGAAKPITKSKGPMHAPAFSPDGKWVAYVGHENEHGRVTEAGVYVMPAKGGRTRKITARFDRGYGNAMLNDLRAAAEGAGPEPMWSRDGKQLFFIATDGGATQIFAAPAKGGRVKPITRGAHQIYECTYARAANRFALAVSDALNPNDLFVSDPRGALKRVTKLNADLFAELELSKPERFTTRHEGKVIEGWVMKPFGWKASKKYPALLEIHGGPHAAFGNAFFHEMQLFAANGYAVIFTNPRGSAGYGQEFLKAVCKDWGGGDYRDVMAATDAALKKFTWLNKNKLGVLGGSYGGYLTSWIVTHTQRFKAAISERALNNFYSFHGTSDIGAFFGPESQIGFEIWESAEENLAHSPIAHVKNCKTPTLILHSEKDFRCPIEQAEQFYVALKKLRVRTEFVHFPDESHNLSRSGKPKHRQERLERMVEWFKKYV
ncbi:MAG: S9 family peptidase [Chloroflexi bacterium]|nr:S9 family peptidase [Chloroflexota bacterium]